MSEYTIRITRNEKVVFVGMKTDLPEDTGQQTVWFEHHCNNKTEAELLTRYLQDRHSKAIKAIRKVEFFSGWKHGKAKKRAKKFFSYFRYNMQQEATFVHIK